MAENGYVLSVLAVDDDLVYLKILSCKLQQCGFKVTATTKATEALDMLRENRDGFDIVLTDIIMPDMDGFELLETIRKINIPVIMISADGEVETVVKGIKSGAVDYLVKPVKVEDLKKKLPEYVLKKPRSTERCNEDETTNISKTESGSPQKKRKIKETKSEQNGSPKKNRTAWTQYLHSKFVNAVSRIEASNEPDNKVIPTKILQIMNEPGLTRETVASHLQKYRRSLANKSGSNGDYSNEQDLVSSPELSHATENCLDRNGQYEQCGFGYGNVNNANPVFTYPVYGPANMLQQNYIHSSQTHPNPISSPMIPNGYGSRRNSIPLNNTYQMPHFGLNQTPSQYGLPFAENPPFTQYPNAFISDFQIHRGLPNQMSVQPTRAVSPFPQIPSSLQGQHDARNVSFRKWENVNAAGENDGSCDIMNSFNGNEQPKRTEDTQQHPNLQAIDRQNSFGLDDEIRSILMQGGQDVVPLT